VPKIAVEGFDLIVNTRDERGHKPHVHILKAGGKLQVLLDASLMPYKTYRISRRDVTRARELVGEQAFRATYRMVGEVQWIRMFLEAFRFRR
jgi:hypothetical protein